jgi:hypothetical protein
MQPVRPTLIELHPLERIDMALAYLLIKKRNIKIDFVAMRKRWQSKHYHIHRSIIAELTVNAEGTIIEKPRDTSKQSRQGGTE